MITEKPRQAWRSLSPAERLRYLASLRFWLTPGMGVKRHAAVAAAGAVVLMAGVVVGALWLVGDGRREIAEPVEALLGSRGWATFGGPLALAAMLVGAAAMVTSVARLNRSLLSNWMPRPYEAAEVLHERLLLARGPRIVAIGGGTGLSMLLRGLRRQTSRLTAVVAVSDDGGSSGRLRAAYGMPAPGDLADCLAALSDHEATLGRLLQYRFDRGDELRGHTFGNLLITTLTEVEGDFGEALRSINALLDLSGAVYPVTSEPVELVVRKADGQEVVGESRVREHGGAIVGVALRPSHPAALPEVLSALADADLVVLGPGSLFTSTLPPILVPEVAAAIKACGARLVYVCNIMTEQGETDGLDAYGHVRVVGEALGRRPDVVVVNGDVIDAARRAAYRAEGAEEVLVDHAAFARAGVRVERRPLLGAGPHAQHDPDKVAALLADLALADRP
jgi:uncharacterized cofD-like protein